MTLPTRETILDRCRVCGDPATCAAGPLTRCARCRERYESYRCARCDARVEIWLGVAHNEYCTTCDTRLKIDGLSPASREEIRQAYRSGEMHVAVEAAMRLGGLDWHGALQAVRELRS